MKFKPKALNSYSLASRTLHKNKPVQPIQLEFGDLTRNRRGVGRRLSRPS